MAGPSRGGGRGGGRSNNNSRGGGGGVNYINSTNRNKQANNHSRKSRGAASAAAATANASKTVKSLSNIYSVEDEDESQSLRRRKRHLDEVENYEYNVDEIEDEDDEEIDSDEAFEEGDEEKYENFEFYGSKNQQANKEKKAKAKAAKEAKSGKGKAKATSDDELEMSQDDESESEEEESEEEEGAEYMDISEMLDQPQSDEEIPLPKKTKVKGFNDSESDEDEPFSFDVPGAGASDDDGEEASEGEQDDDEDEDEDEEMDEEEGSNLTSFIDSLETSVKKRKNDTTESGAKKSRKTSNLRERTEAYDESEYNLQAHRSAAAQAGNKKKLDLMDLVSTFQDEAGFSALKKNIQNLESGPKKGKSVETLTAPLPKIVQDRLNRQAAYEEAKKEVTKWLPIVQKNRQADHLVFPMNATPASTQSSTSLASKFEVTTPMEKEVEAVLLDAGMQEKKLVEFEELALNKMSTEEVQKRRQELRMMRDLMFRDEIRAKRVSKIKSKLFRKIKKKERERHALSTEDMADMDPNMAQEDRLAAETRRAQERMTLKHKNTGKWAKDQLKHGNFDPESRQAITEQIERGDRLRRKIQDVGSDEEQSGGESEYSDFEDDDVEGIKARAFDELAHVEHQLAKEEDAALEAKVGKGVFAMKFMKDAAKRSKMQAQVAAEEFRKELEEEDALRAQGSSDDEAPEVEEWQTVSKKQRKKEEAAKKAAAAEAGTVIGSGGRMVFGAAAVAAVGKNQNGHISQESNVDVAMNAGGQVKKVAMSGAHTTKVQGPVSINVKSSRAALSTAQNDDDSDNETSNPWLKMDKHGEGKIQRKNKDKAAGKDSSRSDKIEAKLKKQKKGGAGSDDEVQIDASSFLTLSKEKQDQRGLSAVTKVPQPSAAKKVAQSAGAESGEDNDDHEADSGSDGEEAPTMVHAKSAKALTQREMVARAFANDNVVSEFEQEKAATIEADKPKDVDLTLPGWGSWAGKGSKKKKKNVVVQKAAPGEGVAANKRKDAKLAHVIINEKRDKKAAAYAVTKIPHPFTTWAQYEASLRTPVGKEWNAFAVYQDNIKPRVLTKAGAIIDPLTAPFK